MSRQQSSLPVNGSGTTEQPGAEKGHSSSGILVWSAAPSSSHGGSWEPQGQFNMPLPPPPPPPPGNLFNLELPPPPPPPLPPPPPPPPKQLQPVKWNPALKFEPRKPLTSPTQLSFQRVSTTPSRWDIPKASRKSASGPVSVMHHEVHNPEGYFGSLPPAHPEDTIAVMQDSNNKRSKPLLAGVVASDTFPAKKHPFPLFTLNSNVSDNDMEFSSDDNEQSPQTKPHANDTPSQYKKGPTPVVLDLASPANDSKSAGTSSALPTPHHKALRIVSSSPETTTAISSQQEGRKRKRKKSIQVPTLHEACQWATGKVSHEVSTNLMKQLEVQESSTRSAANTIVTEEKESGQEPQGKKRKRRKRGGRRGRGGGNRKTVTKESDNTGAESTAVSALDGAIDQEPSLQESSPVNVSVDVDRDANSLQESSLKKRTRGVRGRKKVRGRRNSKSETKESNGAEESINAGALIGAVEPEPSLKDRSHLNASVDGVARPVPDSTPAVSNLVDEATRKRQEALVQELARKRAQLQAAHEKRQQVLLRHEKQQQQQSSDDNDDDDFFLLTDSLPPITALQKGVTLVVTNLSESGPQDMVRFMKEPWDKWQEDEEYDWYDSDDALSVSGNESDTIVSTPVLEASKKKSESLQQNILFLKRKLELKTKELEAKKKTKMGGNEGAVPEQEHAFDKPMESVLPFAPELDNDDDSRPSVFLTADEAEENSEVEMEAALEPQEELGRKEVQACDTGSVKASNDIARDRIMSTPAMKLRLLKRKVELELRRKELVRKRHEITTKEVPENEGPGTEAYESSQQDIAEPTVATPSKEALKKRHEELQVLVEIKNLRRAMTQQRQFLAQHQLSMENNAKELTRIQDEIEREEQLEQESQARLEELKSRQGDIDSRILSTTAKLMNARKHLDMEQQRLQHVTISSD